MAITNTELRNSLAVLGRSETEILKVFKRKRIKGTPGDPQFCLIANYLRKSFPKEEVIEVGDRITVNGASISAPKVFRQIINGFDELENRDLNAYDVDDYLSESLQETLKLYAPFVEAAEPPAAKKKPKPKLKPKKFAPISTDAALY